MRFLLALCAVTGGTLCGSALSGALRRRVMTLESILQGIRVLRLHMIAMFEPVSQALRSSGCALMEELAEGMTPGTSAAQAWANLRDRLRRRGGIMDALAAEDLSALDHLFEALGETGRNQQDVLLSAAQEAMARHLEAARKRAEETDRLYISLGALTGLMVALVVL